MEATVNSIAETLPSEILERIFSYFTPEDVVQSIQNVCSWWRQVAQSSSLWKRLEYCPNRDTSCEQVVEMLKISPKLQNLSLKNKCCDNSVLQAITDNCPELRNLQISRLLCLHIYFMKKLQEKCPKVEHLRIGDKILKNIDMCKVVGKFTNLKILLVTGLLDAKVSIYLRPIADHCKELEHFEFRCLKFEMNDLRHLLLMRKDTLHTLGVCCCSKSGECVLPAVSTCKLKSLSLFAYWRCRRHNKEINLFGQLKTVRALTIEGLLFEESDRIKKIFENESMSQLRKLNLYISHLFDDYVTEAILNNCPLLQTLTLDCCLNMTDASLKTLLNFKELNSLTLSSNHITDTGFVHLQDMHHLNCLRIANCSRLSKEGFKSIARLSTLRELKLWRQDLAEFPWNLIPHQMKYLSCLGIYFCRNVDVCAIEKLKSQCPAFNVCYQEIEIVHSTDFRWDHGV